MGGHDQERSTVKRYFELYFRHPILFSLPMVVALIAGLGYATRAAQDVLLVRHGLLRMHHSPMHVHTDVRGLAGSRDAGGGQDGHPPGVPRDPELP